jgi:predicted alpha-1,2-mannosidase
MPNCTRPACSLIRGLPLLACAVLIFVLTHGTTPAAWADAHRTAGLTAWQLVDPFVGTSGTPQGGAIDTYPGASRPFGMIQWSPDTPSEPAGGGYNYPDHRILGFGLTHLSGPGCSVMGDFDILPNSGAVVKPWSQSAVFSHTTEVAHPGWYAVSLGRPAIRAEITVTRRTGLGRFTFPAGTSQHLLFKVSSDQAGVSAARFQVMNRREVAGSATSGGFCGMPDRFTVYFVARFNRPLHHSGTWSNNRVHPGARSVSGVGSGGWVSFPANRRSVKVQVAISYVSIKGALANLKAGARTWSLKRVRRQAKQTWTRLLGRIRIRGGTRSERVTFYSALYHALLQPTLFSDVTGRYIGFDGRIHQLPRGDAQYANFSGWDIYRTEIPLLALLVPRRTSEMMQSLVRDAAQGGWLPKWPLANGYTGVMGGDSADAILAGAYAFGARRFNARQALHFMVRGATRTHGRPGQGWYVERPGLSFYLKHGYVAHNLTTSVAPVPNGASETLEYSLDDFSIAELAKALGARAIAVRFLRRSMNWAHLLDTSAHEILPRNRSGAFLVTPLTANGQSGFQEGNAIQYTWMVPEDLTDLIRGLGGRLATRRLLNRFFTHLNAGQSQPFAWLGNEPTIGSPWVYLSDGAPWRTQAVLRRALTTLYLPTPAGLPGNDDLGTMSAWYVWSAIGLYPQNPSVRDLDIGSPLFREVRLDSPQGLRITVKAPTAAPNRPYVRALSINGQPDARTWLALPATGQLTLDFTLAAHPDRQWGSAPADAPPSFPAGPLHFPPSTSIRLTALHRQYLLRPGSRATVAFRFVGQPTTRHTVLHWTLGLPHALGARTLRGQVSLKAKNHRTVRLTVRIPNALRSGYYDLRVGARTTTGAILPTLLIPLRISTHPASSLPLLYSLGNADNAVVAVDPDNGALGPEIAVGNNPDAAVFGPHGRRLFVANSGSNSLSVIDTRSQKIIATLATGESPSALLIDPGQSILWVANSGSNTVEPFDLKTLKAETPIATGPGPDALALDPAGTHLYVAEGGTEDILPILTASRKTETAIPVGGSPSALALSPNGQRLYVVESSRDLVVPLDLLSDKTLPAIPSGLMPGTPALSRSGRILYVPDYATNRITPIDTRLGRALRPIPAGVGPFDVVLGALGRSIYVSDGAEGTLVRIWRHSGRRAYTVRTVSLPVAIAGSWDP